MSTNVSPRPRQRRRGAASIVTLFAALLLAGCASSNLAGDSAGEVPAVAEPADAAPEALPADTDGLLVLPDQRMVVHSASMSLLVEDVDEAAAEVKEWVRQAGGYVASETANAASGRNPQVRLSLRVPVDSYEEALNAFAALGTRQSLERSVTDVTEEVADVDSRVGGFRGKVRGAVAGAAGRGGHDQRHSGDRGADQLPPSRVGGHAGAAAGPGRSDLVCHGGRGVEAALFSGPRGRRRLPRLRRGSCCGLARSADRGGRGRRGHRLAAAVHRGGCGGR